jgi:hypothetical protein
MVSGYLIFLAGVLTGMGCAGIAAVTFILRRVIEK